MVAVGHPATLGYPEYSRQVPPPGLGTQLWKKGQKVPIVAATMSRPEAHQIEATLIGKRLRWAREAADMTQVQLAAHCGVEPITIRVMEAGKRAPSVFLAMSLCHVLRISPHYLLWGILQEVDPVMLAKLSRAHPELKIPDGPVRHSEMPNPGKTRKTVRRNASEEMQIL